MKQLMQILQWTSELHRQGGGGLGGVQEGECPVKPLNSSACVSRLCSALQRTAERGEEK